MTQYINPGVYTREKDNTLMYPGHLDLSMALVGPTAKGKPFVPKVVSSYNEFIQNFGDKFLLNHDYEEYFTSISAREFFQNGGGSLLVTKIVKGYNFNNGFVEKTIIGHDGENEINIFKAKSLHYSHNGDEYFKLSIENVDNIEGTFDILIKNQENELLESFTVSLDPKRDNYISKVVGDTFEYYNGTTHEIEEIGEFGNNSKYIFISDVIHKHIDSLDENGNYVYNGENYKFPDIATYNFEQINNPLPTSPSLYENIGDGSDSEVNNTQGVSSTEYSLVFNLLNNKDEYNFNVIVAPGLISNSELVGLVDTRKDAIAIIDNVLYNDSITQAVNKAKAINSSYAATYFPWVKIYNSVLGKSVWIPSSTVMLGVFAFNDKMAQPFFAPAGFKRGGLSSVIKTNKKLSPEDRKLLYKNNVNPLAKFPNQGIVAFGQKTLQKKKSATDRINVRRLVIMLKHKLSEFGSELLFDNNTTALRNSFLSKADPYMKKVVEDQGLYNYQVIMDESNNTGEVIDRNELRGYIVIQPTKSVEYVILDFKVEPTGVQFPEITRN